MKRKVTVQKQKGVDTPEPSKSKGDKAKPLDQATENKEDDQMATNTPAGKQRRKEEKSGKAATKTMTSRWLVLWNSNMRVESYKLKTKRKLSQTGQ